MATPAPCADAMRPAVAIDQPAAGEARARRCFFGVTAATSAACLIATGIRCGSMAAMAGVPMPGGWMLSMPWIRLCGESWTAASADFAGMWLVMMVAMMLPSLAPLLWRYRQAAGAPGTVSRDALVLLVAAGYFAAWLVAGAVVFSLGTALAEAALRRPALAAAMPLAGGLIVLAGALAQFSPAKARHLACWRRLPGSGRTLTAGPCAAFLGGLRIGRHCVAGSAGLTAILLVCGVMDLAAMAVVTAAITAERLAPAGEEVARATGAGALGVGLVLTAQAVIALA